MIKPTDEQIKKFWEWCGLYTKKHGGGWDMWYSPNGVFIGNNSPPIDLNNLFKYAVPKAIKKLANIDLSTDKEAMYKLFCLWIEKFWSETMSMEDALFQAIWEVITSE